MTRMPETEPTFEVGILKRIGKLADNPDAHPVLKKLIQLLLQFLMEALKEMLIPISNTPTEPDA